MAWITTENIINKNLRIVGGGTLNDALKQGAATDTKPAKKPKYGNVKAEIGGVKFDSLKEANRYQELLMLQRIGEITHLEPHPVYLLIVEGTLIGKYIADSSYFESGVFIVEDVKSEITRKNPLYRIKKKIVFAIYGIEIREV